MHGADDIASMQVTSCHIIKHRDTQKPRGCFVEFETREDLEKALLKDGTVRMNICDPKASLHTSSFCKPFDIIGGWLGQQC